MNDLISKKKKIIELFDGYIIETIQIDDFVQQISQFAQDNELQQIDLFKSILNEIVEYGHELSKKEIKQRKLMIESYLH